jgi:hypothetical protein
MESLHAETGTLLQETTEQVLRAAHATAHEQLSAAWQLHVDRVEQELRTGWRDNLEHALRDVFEDIARELLPGMEQAVEARFGAELESLRSRMAADAEAAREELHAQYERNLVHERAGLARQFTERINQVGRRLGQAQDEREWAIALLDGAVPFAARRAVFAVADGTVRAIAAAGAGAEGIEGAPVPLGEAPAFRSVIETKEPVITTFAGSQISGVLAERLGGSAGDRIYLVPLEHEGAVVRVLMAEGPDLDLNAIELLATLGSGAWLPRFAPKTVAASPPSEMSAAPAAAFDELKTPAPDWGDLSRDDQDLHLRAQRFARVQVAEIRLYKSQEVKQGRANRSLYSLLREDIDRGRESYREQFLNANPAMVDYLHRELVKTLANQDSSLLGEDYPGPLV